LWRHHQVKGVLWVKQRVLDLPWVDYGSQHQSHSCYGVHNDCYEAQRAGRLRRVDSVRVMLGAKHLRVTHCVRTGSCAGVDMLLPPVMCDCRIWPCRCSTT